MRQLSFDSELVRALEVACDQCGREILLSEDRNFCSKCGKDLCLGCRTCGTAGEHQLVTYRGFREISRADVILAKAKQYLNESCGSHLFHGEENIYLAELLALLDVLEVKENRLVGLGLESLSTHHRRFVQEHGERFLREWVSLRDMGRFVDYFDRRAFAGYLPGLAVYLQSQGSYAPISWKGKPMMRTVWDFALSAIMVQEIKPQTIIELGTASGASAIWYADLQRLHDLTPRVITMDIHPPSLQYEGVTFLKGDSNAIEEALSLALLREQPHPWIVIEDSHVNILGILDYLHASFHTGDYIIIEDIDVENLLVDFLSKHRGCYRVDARYTDFFGHNTTCAADQIFCRVA